jgi:CheY-like chemotaxis protein
VELLSKPYSRQQLAFKVRQVLGNSDTETIEPGQADTRPGDGAGPVANGEGMRILVVEDDAASLDATCELLTLIGMSPQRAESAAAALDALQAGDFDVLFTDVVMPDLSGTELARRAFATRPELRIIFASGNAVPDHQRLEFEWSALRKPFTLDQLRAALLPASNSRAELHAGDGQAEDNRRVK